MKVQEIKAKMKKIVGRESTPFLCAMFEKTDTDNREEIPEVREAIMDELERRNPEAFNLWIESTESPTKFFK